jgi:hypothetical protein
MTITTVTEWIAGTADVTTITDVAAQSMRTTDATIAGKL